MCLSLLFFCDPVEVQPMPLMWDSSSPVIHTGGWSRRHVLRLLGIPLVFKVVYILCLCDPTLLIFKFCYYVFYLIHSPVRLSPELSNWVIEGLVFFLLHCHFGFRFPSHFYLLTEFRSKIPDRLCPLIHLDYLCFRRLDSGAHSCAL